jgi:hypothetical protein
MLKTIMLKSSAILHVNVLVYNFPSNHKKKENIGVQMVYFLILEKRKVKLI